MFAGMWHFLNLRHITTEVWLRMKTITTVVMYLLTLRSDAAQTNWTFSFGISSSWRVDFLDATISGVIGNANFNWTGYIWYSLMKAFSPIWNLNSRSFWMAERCPSFSLKRVLLKTSAPLFIASKLSR